jgi:hypothetical protein
MKRLRILLTLLAVPICALPAQAQFFHKRAARPIPAQRVPELILILKTETDERKRAQAAEELRDYDSRTYSEIVPVLIDVLHNDRKTGVRIEALNSLARLRPISQPAGQAIEHAASSDESLRVRLQAKSALLKYHIAGYSSSTKSEPTVFAPTMQEPPLAEPTSPTVPAVAFPPNTAPKVTPAAGTPATSGPALDLPRPLPAGIVLPPGVAPPLPPTIQIEGPVLPPRPY